MMSNETKYITAVGYDVDGTMVDSEPLHVRAWHETLENYNRSFDELPVDFQNTIAGRKPLAIATYMIEKLGITVAPEEFLGYKHNSFMEKVKTDLRPMPGVVESVKRLGSEYVLGIGTSLDREYIDIVLDVLGVAKDFAVIVTGDQIKNGKPDPETYLTLAQKLGVKPQQMVVLEDAKSGVESAKAAGSWCIAVDNKNAVPQNTSQADLVVESLEYVTADIISRFK